MTVQKRRIALSVLKEAIVGLKADIVLLQEVAGKTRKGGKDGPLPVTSHQLEELADSIWPYYAYGRNSVFSGGFHGNAILSKFPIVKHENIDISVKLIKREVPHKVFPKRGILHAEVQLPTGWGNAHVLGTHFGLLQYERQKQLSHLCQVVKDRIPAQTPCLLAGDFNDWRERISTRLLRACRLDEAFLVGHSKHARTFPSRFPVLCLDRIYFRGLSLQHAARLEGQPWQLLSDHLPLVADFKLARAKS